MTEKADLIAGRYRLIAQIGSGGMGVVWRARDELLGRTVALKELAVRSVSGLAGPGLGDEGARRAMREARIAARLHHPNVIGIYDIVDHDGHPFLVMEYLESRSLAELMAGEELLPPPEVARIGAQLASALTSAHEAGVIHRDVKPGNVLLAKDGEVKLTDFGISRAVGDTTVTASGVLLGTLGYIAPEVAQGQPSDSRSDVYALGATLYAAVEGHPPFGTDDNAVALLYRIVHEDLIPARHAGPLEPVLLWMLERDPNLRPTMPEAQRALRAVESGSAQPIPAPTVPIADATPPLTTPAEADGSAPGSAVPGAAAAAATVPESSAAASPAAAAPASAPPAPIPPAPRKRFALGERPRRAVIAVLAAALLLALGGWALAVSLSDRSNSTTAGSSTSAGSHAAASSSAPVISLQPSNTAVPKSSASPAATASTPPQQSRADELTATIVDYYKLMPGNLTEGWTWMTADYQQNHAGGWKGYQSFWSQIQRVAVSGVTASPPSTVTATIDYYYKNGSHIEERTQFGLVSQQGRWLIASSSVLSHSGG